MPQRTRKAVTTSYKPRHARSQSVEVLFEGRRVVRSEGGSLKFEAGANLKRISKMDVPPLLRQISGVRNPDLYFATNDHKTELGGIEITLHSPDGSNVE